MPERTEFAARLIELREARSMSQQRLAEEAGMSPTGIAKIESGRVERPRYDTVLKLARGLGIAPEALMGLAEAGDPSAPDVRAVEAAANTPEHLTGEAPQEPADQPKAEGRRLSNDALRLVGMYGSGWRAAAERAAEGAAAERLEILMLRDEPRLGMSEAAFSGWGFMIPPMSTRVEFEAAMGRYGTPEDLWEKVVGLARSRGATEKDLGNFSRIYSPDALMREAREPGYLDGPEALGDPEVNASHERVLESLDSPGAGVSGRDLIKKWRGYVMRVDPAGLRAALGGLVVPGADNYDPVLDEYFGFNGRKQPARKIARRLGVEEGVVRAYVAAVLESYPFSEAEMGRAATASKGARHLWPEENPVRATQTAKESG